MKALVTYASITGNTERLAKGIYDSLNLSNKTIMPINQVTNLNEYDLIILGFWAWRKKCSIDVENFIAKLNNKKVFIFGTLGFYSDSNHAKETMANVIQLVEEGEGNEVLSNFICSGSLNPEKIKDKIENPEKYKHPISKEKLIRFEVLKKHPTKTDIAFAVERFNDRIEILNRLLEEKNEA